jgi:hypothetical protein
MYGTDDDAQAIFSREPGMLVSYVVVVDKVRGEY